jgi:hypothetical protein
VLRGGTGSDTAARAARIRAQAFQGARPCACWASFKATHRRHHPPPRLGSSAGSMPEVLTEVPEAAA